MTKKLLLPLLLLVSVLASCQGGGNNNLGKADSEIQITTAVGNTVVSTATTKGAISLAIGQKRDFHIIRTVRTNGIPVKTDVTALVDFNFSAPLGASMDVTGELTGLAAGLTTLEVVYREDNIPSNDDKVSLDITVSPL